MVLLDVNSLEVGYKGIAVSEPISFTLGEKELISIEGKNGSGKSTLIKTLLNNLKAVSGRFAWNIEMTAIAYLPQIASSDLNSSISVKEIYHLYDVSDDLWDFAGKHILEKKWIDLSGGEKQKVLLLTRISPEINVLVLDEPYNHLDKPSCLDLKSMIEMLITKTSISMLIVSHQEMDYIVPKKKFVRM